MLFVEVYVQAFSAVNDLTGKSREQGKPTERWGRELRV